MKGAVAHALAAIALWNAGTVSAQTIAGTTPYPAVFGGAAERIASRDHHIDTSVSIAGAFDDNGNDVAAGTRSLFDNDAFYTSLNARIDYAWGGRNTRIDADFGSGGRYYTSQRQMIGVDQHARVGIVTGLTRRTQLAMTQDIGFSPGYFTGIFPGLEGVGGPLQRDAEFDHPVSDLGALSHSTSAIVTQRFSPRTAATLTAALERQRFDPATGYGTTQMASVGGAFMRRVTRHASVRLGYGYRRGRVGLLDSTTEAHDVQSGLDYQRPLSFLRRTWFGFSLGSTVVEEPLNGARTWRYGVTGNFALDHEISRTWRARLAYDRAFRFIGGLPAPTFQNGITGSLNGFMTRRLDLAVTGGYTRGDVADLAAGNGVSSYSGSARIRYALTRRWAAFGEYSHFEFSSGSGIRLPAGVSNFHQRSGGRAGLTLWLPVLGR